MSLARFPRETRRCAHCHISLRLGTPASHRYCERCYRLGKAAHYIALAAQLYRDHRSSRR